MPSGLARELLLAVVVAPHTLILSPAILAEVDRVLRYPHVHARWPLTDDTIRHYLELLEEVAVVVDLPEEIPAVVSDPDDDPILQTAILGAAEVLCSRDVAFLAAPVEALCRAHGIRVLDDIVLRQELRAGQS
jgi:putative PIN family toxin of toxin-antitoxin system